MRDCVYAKDVAGIFYYALGQAPTATWYGLPARMCWEKQTRHDMCWFGNDNEGQMKAEPNESVIMALVGWGLERKQMASRICVFLVRWAVG